MCDGKSLADVTAEFEADNTRRAAEVTYRGAAEAVDLGATLKKFHYGDGLTDDEFAAMYEFFTRAEQDLWELTKHFDAGFGLARKEVNRSLQTLEGFKRARDERKQTP